MTNLREAAQMALDALETITSKVAPMSYYCSFAVEIESLRAALAQPEQESSNNGNWRHVCIKFNDQPPCGANFSQKDLLDRWSKDFQVYLDGKPADIYTAPPQREWVGLTDEESEDACWTEVDQRLRSFARAIEAKLKEKNT